MVLVMLLRMALMAPFMGVWAIIKAYHAAPSMTWIMGLAIAILVTFIAALFGLAIPRYRRNVAYIRQRPALLDGSVEDNLRYPFELRTYRDVRFDHVRLAIDRLGLWMAGIGASPAGAAA